MRIEFNTVSRLFLSSVKYLYQLPNSETLKQNNTRRRIGLAYSKNKCKNISICDSHVITVFHHSFDTPKLNYLYLAKYFMQVNFESSYFKYMNM